MRFFGLFSKRKPEPPAPAAVAKRPAPKPKTPGTARVWDDYEPRRRRESDDFATGLLLGSALGSMGGAESVLVEAARPSLESGGGSFGGGGASESWGGGSSDSGSSSSCDSGGGSCGGGD